MSIHNSSGDDFDENDPRGLDDPQMLSANEIGRARADFLSAELKRCQAYTWGAGNEIRLYAEQIRRELWRRYELGGSL